MEKRKPAHEAVLEQPKQYLDDWTTHLAATIQDMDNINDFQFNMQSQHFIPLPQQATLPSSSGGKQFFPTPQQATLPSSSGKKQVKQTNVAHRGTAFTKEEDVVLCKAFLQVSKDPIAGVNQNSGAYYKRLHDFFCEKKPEQSTRSQISLQKRWTLIQRAVSKFSACKSKVDRRNESGKNEYDRIDDAVKMFEEKEPFQFMHCWKLLCNEPKWNDKLLELNSNASVSKGGPTPKDPCNPINTQPSDENTTITRPEGRDSAKRRRLKEDTASSSAAVEVLQQMHQRNERTEEKQDQQMQEILNLKEEKMKLTEKIFNLQKQDMEVRSKFKEEQLSLTKKDIEARAKQSEAQLLTAELGIMGADLDKLSPQVRAYYAAMQRQIMERRGIITPENNDEA